MNLLMIGDWLVAGFATIFVSILDGVAYWLLSVSYNIFYAVAQLDIFGGSTAGETLYNEITSRIYTILSIVMVFIFAYQLIMMIADPDGKAKEGASHLVRDTLISIVLIIVLPLVYRYMSLFQYHVLENNTIPAIILGTNGSSADNPPGKNIAMMVLISFYHPNGTTYNTFFDEEGKVRGDAYDTCLSETAAEDGEEHPKTCEKFVNRITDWENSDSLGNGLSGLVWDFDLKGYIFDTMSYTFVISTGAALAVAWKFLCYALDVGVRAVKLGVLQLISPVPIILKIFPQTKKSFDKWFFQIKKTYVELFVRIAVIFFGLEIIKLIPAFIRIIFDSNNNIQTDGFTKCVATVILILGILRFCQDAPGLFKEIFDTGGGLFSGINLKPGVKNRLEENKALMKGYNKTATIAGGAIGQFKRQYELNRKTAGNTVVSENKGKAFLSAMPAALRGVVQGAKQKSNQTTISSDAFKNAMLDSSNAVNKDFYANEKLVQKAENRAQYLRNITQTGEEDAMTRKEARDVYREANKKARVDYREDRRQTRSDAKDYFNEQLAGGGQQVSVSAQSLKTITDNIKNIVDNAKTPALDDRIKALESEMNKIVDKDSAEYKSYKTAVDNLKDERRTKRSEQYNENQTARQYMANAVADITKAIKNSPNVNMSSKLKQSLLDVAQLRGEYLGKDINSLSNQDFQKILDSTMTKFQDMSGTDAAKLTGADMKVLDEIKTTYADAQRFSSALQEQNTAAAEAAFKKVQSNEAPKNDAKK